MTSPSHGLGLAAADFLIACACYVLASYATAEVDPNVYLLYEGGLYFIALTAGIVVTAFYFGGLYSSVARRPGIILVQQLSSALGITFLSQALIDYVARGLGLRLPVMLYGSVMAIPALLGWRLLYGAVALRSSAQRVLLVRATPLMREIGAYIRQAPGSGLAVCGYLDDDLPAGTVLEGGEVLGPVSGLVEAWQARRVDRVVVDFAGEEQLPAPLANTGMIRGITLERASRVYEALFRRVSVVHLPASAAVFRSEMEPTSAQLALQSVYNNVLGLAALVAFAPLMIAIAALIKLTSPGPAREARKVVGWNEIPFLLFRFRCTRAEFPEYTVVGRRLRRWGLDRLPELENIVRGEMAFVGPRPVPVGEVSRLSDEMPFYRLRFAVRPGFIGWSHSCSGPAPAGAARELEYDLYYVKHLSAGLDAYIVLQALGSLFRGRAPESPDEES